MQAWLLKSASSPEEDLTGCQTQPTGWRRSPKMAAVPLRFELHHHPFRVDTGKRNLHFSRAAPLAHRHQKRIGHRWVIRAPPPRNFAKIAASSSRVITRFFFITERPKPKFLHGLNSEKPRATASLIITSCTSAVMDTPLQGISFIRLAYDLGPVKFYPKLEPPLTADT